MDANATLAPAVTNATLAPTIAPAPITAEELHEVLVKSHIIGHRARRKFIHALYAMDASRLYLKLGFSSIAQYAEKHFGCQRSQTYELLAVAKVLSDLPQCDKAFQSGTLFWSALREIAKLATPETEAQWIEFAKTRSLTQLQAEVKEALKKGRKLPRKDGHSLPCLTVRMAFDLQPHEHDLVSKALKKAAREMGQSLGGGVVEPKDALLYLATRLLETEPAEGGAARRTEREDSIYTILYQRCPDCRKATLPTADGPVEIQEEVVGRVEGEAKTVTISAEEERPAAVEVEPEETEPRPAPLEERDRPNTPTITTKVFLRDGRVCSNPMCRRNLGLHGHHIHFRSRGGKTLLSNEVLVCTTCHALMHMALLKLEGNPLDGLTWTPRSAQLELNVEEELREVSSASDVRVVRESTRVDSPAPTYEIDQAYVRTLVRLGYTKKEAEWRVATAYAQLSGGPQKPKDEDILLAAFRA